MSRSRCVLFLAVALTAAAACNRGAGSGATPVRVGLVGALTGLEAQHGQTIRDGALLAIEQANVGGGVKGRRLELRAYDSQGRPEEAANATVRLVSQDGVALIVGGDSSSSTLAMAPVASRALVPLITPTATSPRVTAEGGPYVFRVCFVDSFQGAGLASFARGQRASRVAMLVDLKSDYSVGLADVFQRRFVELGGTMASAETYASGDTDFRSQLTHIKGQRPDLLFVPGYYSDAAAIARQARQLGLPQPFLGGDGWDSVPELVSLGGEAVEGSMFSTHFSPDNPSVRVQTFRRDFEARFGRPPDSGAALAYDAARIGVEAMRRAPELTGPAIRDRLARTDGFEGVTGRITLGPDRDAVKSAVVLQVRDRHARFVAELSP